MCVYWYIDVSVSVQYCRILGMCVFTFHVFVASSAGSFVVSPSCGTESVATGDDCQPTRLASKLAQQRPHLSLGIGWATEPLHLKVCECVCVCVCVCVLQLSRTKNAFSYVKTITVLHTLIHMVSEFLRHILRGPGRERHSCVFREYGFIKLLFIKQELNSSVLKIRRRDEHFLRNSIHFLIAQH